MNSKFCIILLFFNVFVCMSVEINCIVVILLGIINV